jgi:hypothetical protein
LPTRARRLLIRDRAIDLPAYLPAISSLRSQLLWTTYLDWLVSANVPAFLISAYDVAALPKQERAQVFERVRTARANGVVVFLDSGGYESSWLRAKWPYDRFTATVAELDVDVLLTFDEPGLPVVDTYQKALLDLTRDARLPGDAVVVPILHGSAEQLVDAVPRIASLGPPMIAVPERELGSGIDERIGNVIRIRRAISDAGQDSPLHLLGTGDPRAILAYSYAGADSFDATEWSQMAVDHTTSEMLPSPRYDWVRSQSVFGDEPVDYHAQLMGHNLTFYDDWITRVRSAVATGDWSMGESYLPAEVMKQLQVAEK